MTPKTREQVYKEALEKIAKHGDVLLRADGCYQAVKHIAQNALLQGKDECPEKKQEHNYPQPNPLCPDCKGTGKFLSDKCLKCQGEGYVIDRLMGKGLTCPNCKGTGEDPQDNLGDPVNCHKCDGTGEIGTGLKTPEKCEIEPIKIDTDLCYIKLAKKINEIINKISGKG